MILVVVGYWFTLSILGAVAWVAASVVADTVRRRR